MDKGYRGQFQFNGKNNFSNNRNYQGLDKASEAINSLLLEICKLSLESGRYQAWDLRRKQLIHKVPFDSKNLGIRILGLPPLGSVSPLID